jgi:hypothetical protein
LKGGGGEAIEEQRRWTMGTLRNESRVPQLVEAAAWRTRPIRGGASCRLVEAQHKKWGRGDGGKSDPSVVAASGKHALPLR